MKKFILSAVAATLVASPLIAAAPADAQTRTVVTKKTVVRTPAYRTWRTGQHFDRRYAQNYRTITTYKTYRLSAPPRAHRWVRSGRDAVLINNRGTVVQVRSRVF